MGALTYSHMGGICQRNSSHELGLPVVDRAGLLCTLIGCNGGGSVRATRTFLLASAAAVAPLGVRAAEKPLVALVSGGPTADATNAAAALIQEKLQDVAAFRNANELVRVNASQRPILDNAVYRRIVRELAATYLILVHVSRVGKSLEIHTRLVELPSAKKLFSGDYRGASQDAVIAEAVRDLRPFFVGATLTELPEILNRLGSTNEQTVAQAQAELRAMRGEALSLTLLEALAETENETAKVALAEKLADLGDSSCMPDLLSALKGSASGGGEPEAVSGFRCQFGTPVCGLAGTTRFKPAAPLIAKLLAEEQARAAALHQRAENASRRLGPDMVTLTPEERARAKKQAEYYSQLVADSKRCQAAAIKALGAVGHPDTAQVLLVTTLIDEYADPARSALVEMGAAATAALLASVSDEQLGTDCLRLLGEIGDEAAAQPLLREFEKAGLFRKGLIVEALGKIGDARAVPVIRGSLDQPYLAPFAIEALGRLRDEGSVPLLMERLDSEALRRTALEALGRIGSQPAIDRLLALLAEIPSPSDQDRILASLGRSRDGSLAPKLLGYVSDADAREHAVSAIQELGVAAEEPLLEATQSQDWPIRRNAIYVLGLVGGTKCVARLQSVADGDDPDLAYMARAALEKVRDRMRTGE